MLLVGAEMASTAVGVAGNNSSPSTPSLAGAAEAARHAYAAMRMKYQCANVRFYQNHLVSK